jgi:catechol-2,3-dioxygenase
MPTLDRVLETALYVDDLSRAAGFYQSVLQLEVLVHDDRLCAFDVAGRSVLLLFRRGASLEGSTLPGGFIPPHDGAGPIHMAFAIPAAELTQWEAWLGKHDVQIESRTTWPRGGESLYFRDPEGHLLELATPGVWATY